MMYLCGSLVVAVAAEEGAIVFILQEVVNAVLACISLRIWSERLGRVFCAGDR